MLIDKLLKLPLFFETPGDSGGRSELEQDMDDMNADEQDNDQQDDQEDQNDDADDSQSDQDDENADDQDEQDEEEQDEEDEEDENKDKDGKDDEEGDEPKPLSIKAVKAEFPEIFKKFPELRNAIFRNSQFSTHFVDPSEAAEAVEKAGEFDRFNVSISNGDPSLLISTLSDTNPKALKGFASKFLGDLQKADKSLYVEAVTPALEEAVALLYAAGEKMKPRDEKRAKNMMLAAQYAADFLFGAPEIPDISKRNVDDHRSPDQDEAERERLQWRQERFQEAAAELGNQVKGEIVAIAEKRISRHYPDMPKYMIKKMAEDTQRSIDAALMRDAQLQAQMRGLWGRAAKSLYSQASKTQIKTTFLGRATTLVAGHLNRVLKDALGKDYKPVANSNKQGDRQRKRKIVSSGHSAGHRESVLDPSKIDYSRTSDADLMSGDPNRVRLKK